MRGNSWSAFLFFLLIALLDFALISNGDELFLGKFKTAKKTNSPIEIDTKKAIEVNYPPLHLHGMKSDLVKLINTGKTVEVIELNPSIRSRASGGVLLEDVYIFEKTKFLWTNNENGTAASQINGKGFPIEAVTYFFNKKYKTFKESLKYRDGLATIIFPVIICSTPSETFPKFAKKLIEVLKAGSSTIMELGTSFAWYDLITENVTVTYYAYPGSYLDLDTGKKHYCETVVIPDYPGACITEEQYAQTFGLVKNLLGEPLYSTEEIYPFRQPVVQAYGMTQTLFE